MNHAQFMGNPGVFVDAGAADDRSTTLVLERCMHWRGFCAFPHGGKINSTCSSTALDDGTPSVASASTTANYVDLLAWDVASISLSDEDMRALGADIIVLHSSLENRAASIDLVSRLGMYRSLPKQGLGSDISIFLRNNFELNIDREGLSTVPFPSIANSPGDKVACSTKPKSPIVGQYKVIRRSGGTRNGGWGTLLMDCVRHLPKSVPLDRLSEALPPRLNFPQTSGRRIGVAWLTPHSANKTDHNSDYFPIMHMDWDTGSSHQICRAPKATLRGNMLGVVSPLTGKCTLQSSTSEADGASPFAIAHFESLFWKTTWSTFGVQSVPKDAFVDASTKIGYAGLMRLIDGHILPDDRDMIAKITGYPFRSVVDVLQRSTKGYLARFLSSKKYVVHDCNKFGLHLVRALLAERLLEARRASLRIDHTHPDIVAFREHGVIVVRASTLQKQLSDPRERADLLRLFQYAAGDDKLVDDSFELFREPVVHQAIDMQHAMHMDSFAATIKVFGFHEEVTMNNGPFHYVNGSHRHTESKLRLIHDLVRDDDEFVICASPRIYPSHQREYGIVATPMVVPEGSVVIADTNGFHFRGKGTPGTRRDFWTTRWKNIEWSHRDIPRFSAFRQNQ
jgi:hypothetical protein